MAASDSFKFIEDEIIGHLNNVNDFFAFYGAFHLLKSLLRSSKIMHHIYLLTKSKLDLKSFGKYAVISSIDVPIGREIAIFLASKGLNLILFTVEESGEVKEFLLMLSTKFQIEAYTVNINMLDHRRSEKIYRIFEAGQLVRKKIKRIKKGKKRSRSKSKSHRKSQLKSDKSSDSDSKRISDNESKRNSNKSSDNESRRKSDSSESDSSDGQSEKSNQESKRKSIKKSDNELKKRLDKQLINMSKKEFGNQSDKRSDKESEKKSDKKSISKTNRNSDYLDHDDKPETAREIKLQKLKDALKRSIEDFNSILKKDIGILINCSDYRPKRFDKFLSYSEEEIEQMITMNLLIPIKLHRLFVKKLASRERGLILNVSSVASTRPLPFLSIYSASKSFVDQLAETIDYEYKNSRIIFKTLITTYFTSFLFSNDLFGHQQNSGQSKTKHQSADQHKIGPQSSTDASTRTNDGTSQLSHSSIIKEKRPGPLLKLLLPDKRRFFSNLLESNYSCTTCGHWLFALEFYFIDSLPNFLLHLGLEYCYASQ